ncbi:hypothetical protein AcetOrient_orf03085 [Acetobacter orientalis]|uniref:Uncharacterized protein n=1 Tax=Acetobacter orientalis TaxID=146474 RepID=A0A2Z5ZJ95_9PROT|nr:hypothetical protein AcetOrient_orf03085 [Acetobacter orientalis]
MFVVLEIIFLEREFQNFIVSINENNKKGLLTLYEQPF